MFGFTYDSLMITDLSQQRRRDDGTHITFLAFSMTSSIQMPAEKCASTSYFSNSTWYSTLILYLRFFVTICLSLLCHKIAEAAAAICLSLLCFLLFCSEPLLFASCQVRSFPIAENPKYTLQRHPVTSTIHNPARSQTPATVTACC